MEYEEGLMERADWGKYRLYELLAQPDVQDMTVVDLSDRLALSYNATYGVFCEVLNDIMTILQQPRQVVRKQVLAARPLPVSLEAYRAFLVRRSINFQLLDYLLQAPAPELAQFCENCFTTRSTTTRKLKRLNALLDNWGVTVVLRGMKLTGSEANVRSALADLFAWICADGSWPFAKCPEVDMRHEYQALSVVEEEPAVAWHSQLFLAVSHLRSRAHHHLIKTPMLRALSHTQGFADARRGEIQALMAPETVALFNFIQVWHAHERTVLFAGEKREHPEWLQNEWSQPLLDQLTIAIRRLGYQVNTALRGELTYLLGAYALFTPPYHIAEQHAPMRQVGRLRRVLLAILQGWPLSADFASFRDYDQEFVAAICELVLLKGKSPGADTRRASYSALIKLKAAPTWFGLGIS
ncbi:MAG: helix-turn-helix domain-containing protein [Lactobacillus sp.]|jgi:hypothetical protein|nr:helix-turn-helix domain-containing protein [Lactobacillus sp.]